MKLTLPHELHGARVLESAESRDPAAPWVVLCETSPRCYVVTLLTNAGSSIDSIYHASYATALDDFLGRRATK